MVCCIIHNILCPDSWAGLGWAGLGWAGTRDDGATVCCVPPLRPPSSPRAAAGRTSPRVAHAVFFPRRQLRSGDCRARRWLRRARRRDSVTQPPQRQWPSTSQPHIHPPGAVLRWKAHLNIYVQPRCDTIDIRNIILMIWILDMFNELCSIQYTEFLWSIEVSVDKWIL